MFEDVAKKTKYAVYTKKFDRECRIGDLVDAETIERLGTHFDFHGYEDGNDFAGLGDLAADDVPEGLQLTFLVDMSGSLQGRPIAQVCYGVLAATLALEKLGASVEVLGYTTTGSDGPLEEFNVDRTLTHPGRLSATLHIVAKEAGVAAERSAGSILAMGTKGLHRENLDGEAIIWAARRLVARKGTSKVLVLVTDGFEPNCAVTERFAKDRGFMKAHLKAVVDEIHASGELDFVQVIVDNWFPNRTQDTYISPVSAKYEAAEVARAIGEALSQVLAPVPVSNTTPAPAI
ncbi:hypothetical protein OIU34_17550 [Pararhizobium sp. BT-229]|uniref:cobaltochelatase CobT-related protein n=1 Tax=Pararhizobium sp. BT-229 TaxID=2986923 RepID=UPI0021F7D22F|nr:hypothetical protein [Pararhizobium sp. BT-229]MCV9963703.1 hypothetical protein [Pararhizobium sp. BT-229]